MACRADNENCLRWSHISCFSQRSHLHRGALGLHLCDELYVIFRQNFVRNETVLLQWPALHMALWMFLSSNHGDGLTVVCFLQAVGPGSRGAGGAAVLELQVVKGH